MNGYATTMTSSLCIEFSMSHCTLRWITFIMLITANHGQNCSRKVYNPCRGNATLIFGNEQGTRRADRRRCFSPLHSPLSYDDAKEVCKRNNSTLMELLGTGPMYIFNKRFKSEIYSKYPTDPAVWLHAKYNKTIKKLVWLSKDGSSDPDYWLTSFLNTKPSDIPSDSCFAMKLMKNNKPRAIYVNCSGPRAFFCTSKNWVYKVEKPVMKVLVNVKPDIIDIARGTYYRHSFHAYCNGSTSPIERLSYIGKFNLSDGRDDLIFPFLSEWNFINPSNHAIQNIETYRFAPDGSCARAVSVTLNYPLPRLNAPVNYLFTAICRRHTIDDFKTTSFTCAENDMTCTQRSFFVKDFNEEPSMIEYFHKAPNSMYIDQTALFTCRACVGPYGNISWSILTKLPGVPWWRPHPEVVIALDDERISEKTEPGDATCGRIVHSNLTLVINYKLESRKVACTSFMWHKGARINPERKIGREIKLIAGPTQPKMNIHYHNLLNESIVGKNMTITCTACYQRMGNITWSIISPDDRSQVQMSALNLTYTIHAMEPLFEVGGCKMTITSILTLEISRALANRSIMCQSYKYRYFQGSKAITNSPEFKLIEEEPVPDPPKDPPIEQSFTVLFIFILIVLLVIFALAGLIAFHPEGRDGEEERVAKVDPGIPVIEEGIREDITVISAVDPKEGSQVDGDVQSIRSARSHRSSKSNIKSADGSRQSRRPSHQSSIPQTHGSTTAV